MKKIEIRIPEIAENVESGLIAAVLVSKGDRVEKDQSLVEVETDKATTDIPSTHEGTVEEINVEEGDEVQVSQVIMVLSVEETTVDEQEEKMEGEMEEKEQKEEDGVVEEPTEEMESPEKEKGAGKADREIGATPLVKRIAREEGIDLKGISGSGPHGRITRDDLQSALNEREKGSEPGKETAGDEETGKKEHKPHYGGSVQETREKMSTIRRLTAERMQESWKKIPHVTQFDQADITALEAFREQQKSAIATQGGKLTVTALLLKITSFALQRFPRFNATLDETAKEIIYKHEIHIGVAVDTDRGLMVPVIRHVNRKSLADISRELNEVAERARNKKISPDELLGGTFTVSNLGGIGGTAFTPIVYAPQVAILGISASRHLPLYVDGSLQKRLVIPLSLSYDHRVIDGAEGARFLSWFCRVLENPFEILQ
jgi:pyruvate dehydrogenase E2 component (dihydrolipoamide acetyltransferase)